jgi:hypothetical protein
VRFDDRLLTVLNQPAEDRHDAAVRWRQLVDLVARAGQNGGSSIVGVALDAIRSEAPTVDESLRAAAARAVAAFPLPLGLLEYFAADQLSISAPVLAAATLDQGQWQALLAVADDETRAFIRTLHPELQAEATRPAAPSPAQAMASQESESAGMSEYTPPSLHELVERIERRRRLRAEHSAGPDEREAASRKPPALFRWECGPGGEIAWVDGAPRGALIGRSLAKPQDHERDRLDPDIVRAFAVRAPFRDAMLTVAGAGPVAGDWKISGVPAFDPADGRFAGYRGVALRQEPAPSPSPANVVPEVLADPDSLRELMHEIKTPLNAIIGFAEIIEGQYLGPADRGYRERASDIVRHARKLLTAIDDLDFAAKVHSAAGAGRERVDLSRLVERAAAELRDMASRLHVELDLVHPRSEVAAAVQPELADRLLVRLFSALAERSEAGERLRLSVEAIDGHARIAISRPTALRDASEAALFGPAKYEKGAFDGFSLKLARGLARISGGDLLASRDSLALVFLRV